MYVIDPPLAIHRTRRDPLSCQVTDGSGNTRWRIEPRAAAWAVASWPSAMRCREAALLAPVIGGVIVRLEPGAAPPLRDISLAFALNSRHLYR